MIIINNNNGSISVMIGIAVCAWTLMKVSLQKSDPSSYTKDFDSCIH